MSQPGTQGLLSASSPGLSVRARLLLPSPPQLSALVHAWNTLSPNAPPPTPPFLFTLKGKDSKKLFLTGPYAYTSFHWRTFRRPTFTEQPRELSSPSSTNFWPTFIKPFLCAWHCAKRFVCRPIALFPFMENLLKNVYTPVSVPVLSCSFEPTWNRLLPPFLHFNTHCVFYSHRHSHSQRDLDLQAFLYTCLASSSSACMKCLSPTHAICPSSEPLYKGPRVLKWNFFPISLPLECYSQAFRSMPFIKGVIVH